MILGLRMFFTGLVVGVPIIYFVGIFAENFEERVPVSVQAVLSLLLIGAAISFFAGLLIAIWGFTA